MSVKMGSTCKKPHASPSPMVIAANAEMLRAINTASTGNRAGTRISSHVANPVEQETEWPVWPSSIAANGRNATTIGAHPAERNLGADMAKEELIQFEGLVTEILPDARYRV